MKYLLDLLIFKEKSQHLFCVLSLSCLLTGDIGRYANWDWPEDLWLPGEH